MTSTEDISSYLTMGNAKKSTTEYVSAIASSKDPAWRRVQNGDKSATADFLKSVEPVIDKGISAFASGDRSYKTKARMIALDAVASYDPDRGGSIDTHVYNHLKRLQRESARRGNLTHVPENVAIDRANISRAIREYEADHGTSPTTEDLANMLGMSRNRIDAVMNRKPVVPDSLLINEHGDSWATRDTTQHALDLYNKAIYDELDDIDKKIYEWSTGYGKGERLSSKEMAARLKISPAAVSQRYAKISNKFAQDRDMILRSLQ